MLTATTYLIDGYNLLHRGFLPGRGDLASERARLEVRLREFLRGAPTEVRVILVYDGAQRNASQSIDASAHVVGDARFEIRFSPRGTSADESILREVAAERIRKGHELTVVTSDMKDIARNLPVGVRHLTSEEFADLLDASLEGRLAEAKRESAPPRPAEKPNAEAMTESESQEWLRLFQERKRGR